MTANPMWNQKFPAATYENDPHERFKRGVPPSSSADWGWIQHMAGSLKDGGRMAVVLDTGAVSRGSGNQGSNKERDIRKAFVEADMVEAVVLLPENLFYNTTAPGIILVLNTRKRHKGEILLINGSKLFSKGRPKNYLGENPCQPDQPALPRLEDSGWSLGHRHQGGRSEERLHPLAQPLRREKRRRGGLASRGGRGALARGGGGAHRGRSLPEGSARSLGSGD